MSKNPLCTDTQELIQEIHVVNGNHGPESDSNSDDDGEGHEVPEGYQCLGMKFFIQ
jgi:hypothetical protein